jgi:uncharacterized protein YoaH (UPF0181 family)
MNSDKTLKDPFLQIVDDHIDGGDPPETKSAVDQLLARGRSPGQARKLVAEVVRVEMQAMMAEGREFDNAKFAAALKALLAAEQ